MTTNDDLRPPTAGLSERVFEGRFPGRLPRSLAAWGLLVSVVAVMVMVVDAGRLRNTTWNDTYRYINAIERDLGRSDAEAQAIALNYYCTDLARTTTATAANETDPGAKTSARIESRDRCERYWTAQGGLAPNKPRFNLIFDSRPGYPLLAAPLVAAFGVSDGLALLSVLLTLTAGWGVLLLIRLSGGSPLAALCGMTACFTLPTWFWLQQFLTESPTLVCAIAVLIGAVLMQRGRVNAGLAVSTAAYTAGFLVRYSTFSVLAGCLALTVGVLAWRERRQRTRGTRVLIGFSALAFVIQTVLPPLLGWPGFKDSLEDTFSAHYTAPVPHDLYGKWIALNGHYWVSTVQHYAGQPLVPALMAFGTVLLWRYRQPFAAIVTAAGLAALASAAAHPLTSQLDRLYFLAYLLPICGLPILADLRRRPANARPGPCDDALEPPGLINV